MQLDLSPYSIIVIDASLFFAPLSEELLRELARYQDRLYRASTFEVEAEHLAKVMTPRQLQIYRKNLAALDRLSVRVMPYSSHDGSAGDGYHDTFDLLTRLSRVRRTNQKLLLLTENQNLFQRILIQKLTVDFYIPRNDRLLKSEELADGFDIKFDYKDPRLPRAEISDGDLLTVYTQDGAAVALEPYEINDSFAIGGEARIYQRRDDPTMLAKIFQKKIRRTKYENIVQLAELSKTGVPEWLLLPRELLFKDPDCTQFMGYLEKKARVTWDLYGDPLYSGEILTCDPGDADGFEQILDRKCSETVELCLQLVRQIAFLRNYGICVTDYNKKNFSLYLPEYDWLYMWDTDSFCYGSYCSSFEDKDLIPIHDYNTGTLSGVIDRSTEMLYLLTLSVFTLGHELRGHSEKALWVQDRSNKKLRCLLPSNLLALYERCFGDGKPLSLELLLAELDAAARMFRDHPETDLSYRELLSRGGDVSEPEEPEAESPKIGEPMPETTVREEVIPSFETWGYQTDLDDFFLNEPFPEIELPQTEPTPVQEEFQVALDPIPYKKPKPIPVGKKKPVHHRKRVHPLMIALIVVLIVAVVGAVAGYVLKFDPVAWLKGWATVLLRTGPDSRVSQLCKLKEIIH